MYQGNNPKALLSAKLLSEALIQEMSRQKYEDITIKDICKAGDISRQTFYNFFTSKDELLRQCIDGIFSEIMDQRNEQGFIDATTSISIFVRTFYKNKSFTDLIIKNKLEMVLVEQFMSAISTLTKMSKYNDTIPRVDYHLAFYSGGLAQILFHWCKDPDRIVLDELIKILSESINLPYF